MANQDDLWDPSPMSDACTASTGSPRVSLEPSWPSVASIRALKLIPKVGRVPKHHNALGGDTKNHHGAKKSIKRGDFPSGEATVVVVEDDRSGDFE